MKKQNYKRLILLSLIFLSLFTTKTSFATELNSFETIVKIKEDGKANINMTWDYEDDKGTEHFIPLQTKGIDIYNLKVSRNSDEYVIIDNWNVNGSLEEKQNKAGIIYNKSEMEICWGISEYGKNIYNVSYDIDGLIKEVKDAQMLHFRFLNDMLSEPPKKGRIIIEGPKPFTEEDVKMWAFGFKGEINLMNGRIVAESKQALKQNSFMHILLRFDKDYFNLDQKHYINKTFETFQKEAFKGSDYKINIDSKEFFDFLNFVLMFLIFIFIGLGSFNSVNRNLRLDEKEYKGQYHRETPYDKIEDIFYILKYSGLSNIDNLINYFFLKWIKEGKIKQIKIKEKNAFELLEKPDKSVSYCEQELYAMITLAAGGNNILESKEFDKWINRSSSRFENWIKKTEEDSKEKCLELGFLEKGKEKAFLPSHPVYKKKGNLLAIKHIKFKNYLKDFSLLNERGSIEVSLWDSFMLYAAIFGITDQVKKEFEKLAPKYFSKDANKHSVYTSDDIYISRIYSNSFYSSYRATQRSSGSGGSSSLGGGSGGFGGSSGGGTR